MASITEEVTVAVDVDRAWAALREVGQARALFAPVLVDSSLDGDTRTVRFANGMVLRERILDVDDSRRRVAYTALDAPGMQFHHASMQVGAATPGRCTFVWITDAYPPEVIERISPLIQQGAQALKRNLESGAV